MKLEKKSAYTHSVHENIKNINLQTKVASKLSTDIANFYLYIEIKFFE